MCPEFIHADQSNAKFGLTSAGKFPVIDSEMSGCYFLSAISELLVGRYISCLCVLCKHVSFYFLVICDRFHICFHITSLCYGLFVVVHR